MRQKKRWLSFLTAAALAVGLLVNPAAVQAAPADQGALRQDFYEAVNGDDIAAMEIPADAPSTGRFDVVQEQIQDQMEALSPATRRIFPRMTKTATSTSWALCISARWTPPQGTPTASAVPWRTSSRVLKPRRMWKSC